MHFNNTPLRIKKLDCLIVTVSDFDENCVL